MNEQELNALAEAAGERHDADIFFYSGMISDDGFGQLAEAVTLHHTDKDRVILVLTTNGGAANAAYQIARLLQRLYSEFWLFCPSSCKSAGTLVALGAHRLIMDNFSELGPLDVQLLKEDEIGARKSGLLARATFEALSEEAFNLYERLMLQIKLKSQGLVTYRLASELAASMTSNLLSAVYAQLIPDTIGNEKRDLEIAIHYGVRLATKSKNAPESAVYHLVSNYPSHDFIIDDEEARDLFSNIDVPSEELYKLVGVIGAAYAEAQEPLVCALTRRKEEGIEDEDTEGQGSADERREPPVDDRRSSDRASHSGAAIAGAATDAPVAADPSGKVRQIGARRRDDRPVG